MFVQEEAALYLLGNLVIYFLLSIYARQIQALVNIKSLEGMVKAYC